MQGEDQVVERQQAKGASPKNRPTAIRPLSRRSRNSSVAMRNPLMAKNNETP